MTRLSANTLLFITAALWGVGNVAQKTALDDLGAFTVLAGRSMIGLLVIAPFVLRELQMSPRLGGRGWRDLVVAAAVFCLALSTEQIACGITSVTNTSFIICTTVVFTPLFAWLLTRERPRRMTYAAIAGVLVGVRLMGEEATGLNEGDAWCLVSAILFSLWIVLVARLSRTYSCPFTVAAGQFGLAGLVGLTIALLREPVTPEAFIQAGPELLILGVLSTGAGFTLQVLAQRVATATEVAIIGSAESLFGALAAHVVLGEELTLMATVGACLVLTGILLVQVPWPLRRSTLQPHERWPQAL